MAKSIKVFVSVMVLSMVFLVTFGSSSSATTSDNMVIDKSDAIFDESLGAYITPLELVDGQLVPVSKEEYLAETQSVALTESVEEELEGSYPDNGTGLILTPTGPGSDVVEPNRAYYEYYKFFPSNISTVTGNTRKVTADIDCTLKNGCSISKAVSVTISASYSVSLEAEKNAIKANAGFTWQKQLSDQTTYTFNLANGDKGYIGFKPYLRKSYGTLKRYSNWDGYLSQKTATGWSPKKTATGEADGYTSLFINDYSKKGT